MENYKVFTSDTAAKENLLIDPVLGFSIAVKRHSDHGNS